MKFYKGSKTAHPFFRHQECEVWAYHDSLHIGMAGEQANFSKRDAKKLLNYLNKVLSSKKEYKK